MCKPINSADKWLHFLISKKYSKGIFTKFFNINIYINSFLNNENKNYENFNNISTKTPPGPPKKTHQCIDTTKTTPPIYKILLIPKLCFP